MRSGGWEVDDALQESAGPVAHGRDSAQGSFRGSTRPGCAREVRVQNAQRDLGCDRGSLLASSVGPENWAAACSEGGGPSFLSHHHFSLWIKDLRQALQRQKAVRLCDATGGPRQRKDQGADHGPRVRHLSLSLSLLPFTGGTDSDMLPPHIPYHPRYDDNGCAEFCAGISNIFDVNGIEYRLDFDGAGTQLGCTDQVTEGSIPNEHGTWFYGRNG